MAVAAEPLVPPVVMDRPVLHAFVRELAEHERLVALAEALPTRARVSEPALPLVLAALHERLGRGLVCLLAEDADARDVAEAAAWFEGEELVGYLPSRGVRWESGRKSMLKSHVRPLLRDGWAKKSGVLFDLAVDLLIPPLSYLALGGAGLLALGLLISLTGTLAAATLGAGALCVTSLGLYAARGWWLSETGVRGLAMLAAAPLYVAWKVALMRKQSAPREWVRTQREAEAAKEPEA